jgi:aquaglyceroporin related protein
MLGIYVAGDSGAYLNPAITFNFCLFRKLPWRRFPIYFLAQFLGAFCAAGVVYGNYINAINAFEGGNGIRTVPPVKTASAGIFCTYPQAFMTKVSQFFSEFIASAILMFVIFALKDDSNPGAMGKTGAGVLFPLALFFLIFGLGACFGLVLPLFKPQNRENELTFLPDGKRATLSILFEISHHV